MSKRKYWVVEDDNGGLCSWFAATPKEATQNLRGITHGALNKYGWVPNLNLRQIAKAEFDQIDNNEEVAGLVAVVPGKDRLQ